MYVRDLDDKKLDWRARGQEITLDRRPRSAIHLRAREILKHRFPTAQILEEVPFKPRSKQTLFFDFYLPLYRLAVEVHGQQHYEFVPMFHSTRQDFIQQLRNDADKSEWCAINNIRLIILKYDMVDQWEQMIQ